MMVTLYRRQSEGSTEYVTITDRQGNLFGYPTLTVTTGRDFFLTSERHYTYEDEADLQRALREMVDRRVKKHYEILYSYFRPGQYPDLRARLTATQSARSMPS